MQAAEGSEGSWRAWEPRIWKKKLPGFFRVGVSLWSLLQLQVIFIPNAISFSFTPAAAADSVVVANAPVAVDAFATIVAVVDFALTAATAGVVAFVATTTAVDVDYAFAATTSAVAAVAIFSTIAVVDAALELFLPLFAATAAAAAFSFAATVVFVAFVASTALAVVSVAFLIEIALVPRSPLPRL